jgi:hypothetical protein
VRSPSDCDSLALRPLSDPQISCRAECPTSASARPRSSQPPSPCTGARVASPEPLARGVAPTTLTPPRFAPPPAQVRPSPPPLPPSEPLPGPRTTCSDHSDQSATRGRRVGWSRRWRPRRSRWLGAGRAARARAHRPASRAPAPQTHRALAPQPPPRPPRWSARGRRWSAGGAARAAPSPSPTSSRVLGPRPAPPPPTPASPAPARAIPAPRAATPRRSPSRWRARRLAQAAPRARAGPRLRAAGGPRAGAGVATARAPRRAPSRPRSAAAPAPRRALLCRADRDRMAPLAAPWRPPHAPGRAPAARPGPLGDWASRQGRLVAGSRS